MGMFFLKLQCWYEIWKTERIVKRMIREKAEKNAILEEHKAAIGTADRWL